MSAIASSAIDVVIPVRNGARYLSAAIDSVLGQRGGPALRVIVVDDGSTDDSVALAASYGPPVRLIRQQQAGAAAARNRGIAASDAELLAFLDADDLWPADSLARRHRALVAEPRLDAVFGLAEQFICDRIAADRRPRLHCPPGRHPAYLLGAMLAKASAFERFGRLDPSYAVGDFIAWFAAARERGLAARMIDDLVLRRRLHDANLGLERGERRHDYLRVARAALRRKDDREA
jgi:glycosyltransferase involved in cell wall biosynthesis